MKSMKLALAGLAALAVLPATAPADPGGGQDRANGARACKTLRSTQPAVFASTYGTDANAFGKCVSAWAKAAHAARHAAEASCRPAPSRGKGKGKGNAFGRCVAEETASALNTKVQATENAARICKAERDAIGGTAFKNKYGTNPNKANAFGKCVSSMRSQGAQAGHVRATLTGPVGSGTFSAVLKVRKGELCYRLSTTGLTGITAAHIHVKPNPPGTIVVPLAAPTAGSSRGCVDVAPALLQAILQNPGNYYVNVHTVAAPAGAISGDLRR
jgi:hypothetical protein